MDHSGTLTHSIQRARTTEIRQHAPMTEGGDQRDEWLFDGRYYVVTAFSDVATRDGFGLELEDVGPAPGRGIVLEAFWDDATGKFTFKSCTDGVLPFDLVEQFVRSAREASPARRQGIRRVVRRVESAARNRQYMTASGIGGTWSPFGGT